MLLSESDDLLLSLPLGLLAVRRRRPSLLGDKSDASFFGASASPGASSPLEEAFLSPSALGEGDLEDAIQDLRAKSANEDDLSLVVRNLGVSVLSVVSGFSVVLPASFASFALSLSSGFLDFLSTEDFSVPSDDLLGNHDRGRSAIDLDRLDLVVAAFGTAIGSRSLLGRRGLTA